MLFMCYRAVVQTTLNNNWKCMVNQSITCEGKFGVVL